MKIIITGVAGFIGSHLAELLLKEGHHVVGIDDLITGREENIRHLKGNFDFIKIDILEINKIKKYFSNVDWVFHLAAVADIVPSITDPIKYHNNNVNGTISVLEAARANNVKKFIYSASSSCYGLAKKFPTPETALINPEYPYALTKFLGEQIVLHWHKVYKLPAISLRLFNVYGPRSRTSGTYGAMFGVFLAQKLANKPYTVIEDGNQTRDFIFVTDVARAFLVAAESNVSGEIFNVGSGGTYSINDIIKLLGGGEVVYIPKRPGEPDCTFGDILKIKRVLGWRPEVSLKQGIKVLLDNIDYWKDAPVWTPESIDKVTKKWFEFLN